MGEHSIAFRSREASSPGPVETPATAPAPISELQVDGMECASCAARVTGVLTAVPGVSSAHVDLAAGRATVRWKDAQDGATSPDSSSLVAALQAGGYPARPVERPTHGAASTPLRIEGMDCTSCERKVTEALRQVPGVDRVSVNLAAGTADVRWHPEASGSVEPLIAAVAATGYRASAAATSGTVSSGAGEGTGHTPEHGWQLAMRLGGPVTLILLVGEWVFGLGMERWFQWTAFVLALPVQVWLGGRFYRGAWRQARVGQSNMDTLVALGSTAAFGFSVWGLWTGYHGHLYFMEAAAILTLISVGHWLEARMSSQAGAALKSLLQLAPATARRLETESDPDRETAVPVASLRSGDRIAIRPGDRVPVDAEVIAGESAVNESMLTGESLPVDKASGGRLYAGTENQTGRLVARVLATGEDTALARIIAAVQRAQSSRAGVQRLADRISAVFVPIVIGIALLTALWWGLQYESAAAVHRSLSGWLWMTHMPASPVAAAFAMAAAVLIVACPCAMGLATPTALMAGVNAAARRGILIRDALALEKSGHIRMLVFDKTGTLTQGKPVVVASEDRRDEAERTPSLPAIAAALTRPSQHPLSQAVARWNPAGEPATAAPTLASWQERRGSGVEGTENTPAGPVVWRLGSAAWMEESGIRWQEAGTFLKEHAAAGATVVFVARNQTLVGAMSLRDALKPEARQVLESLRRAGQEVRLLTGDRQDTAVAVAQELGLPADAVTAGVRPEGKASVISELQSSGVRVAFVGDGLNDGPALAQADLGIAVTQATDVAREAADILLLKSDLSAIPQALDLAQTTLRVIRQNLFWAFFYNAAAIPLAATGLLSPVVCAVAMGFSDVIVIGNALRLYRR
ncbi:MAG: heavy metal translocating P-type ATPase [Verrucomicrobia bacterium]|nr:heavy metal translocating P-type ATPase [Verrucomicrobiota bacterium]